MGQSSFQAKFLLQAEDICDTTSRQLGAGYKPVEAKTQVLLSCAGFVEQFCKNLEADFINPKIRFYADAGTRTVVLGVICEEANFRGKKDDPFLEIAQRFDAIQCIRLGSDLMEIRFVLENVWEETNE
jgi:hypothetical protein